MSFIVLSDFCATGIARMSTSRRQFSRLVFLVCVVCRDEFACRWRWRYEFNYYTVLFSRTRLHHPVVLRCQVKALFVEGSYTTRLWRSLPPRTLQPSRSHRPKLLVHDLFLRIRLEVEMRRRAARCSCLGYLSYPRWQCMRVLNIYIQGTVRPAGAPHDS
jgi:hypothetical protein